MYFFTHFVFFSLAYFSSVSSAYQCTLSNAKDVEELDTSTLVQSMSVDMEADLDVAMLASSYQTQALENSAGYIKARKRALDAMSRKLRRRNTGSGNTKNSMTCSSSEICYKGSGQVSCFNTATSTLRDPWGATMNTETGDYRLPDGIRGNLITNPGPLENYDPESGAYDSDDTDRSTDRSTDSAATEAGSRVAGSSSSSAGGGTTNRNNGGGLEILTNDAMPMAIKQSGWALVGFVGVMMVIEWM